MFYEILYKSVGWVGRSETQPTASWMAQTNLIY